jgi:truncated hemoglobin YjbI
MASLYERLGGLDAMTAVVDSFSARCEGDDRINEKFARTDIPRLRKMLVDQICEATGGPCTYSGRDMRAAHDGMGLRPVSSMRSSRIWWRPSTSSTFRRRNRTSGTPLPEGYQAAPALS